MNEEHRIAPVEHDRVIVEESIVDPEVDRTLLVAWADDEIVHIYMAGGLIHALLRKRWCPSKIQSGATLRVDELMIADRYEVDPSSTDPDFVHLLNCLGFKLRFMQADQERADRSLAINSPYHYPFAPVSSTPIH